MKLSIIIVNWNTCELLNHCLGSIQEYPPRFEYEIWVVDNGSSDPSLEMLKEKYPQVRVIEKGENVGFARANNDGMRHAQGAYFLLLNSDTLVRPDALTHIVESAEKYPDAGIVSCKLLNQDGSIQESWSSFPTIDSEMFGRNYRQRKQVQPGSSLYEVDWVGGACLLVRKEAADQVGLLDESFFMYSEEVDWCYRMKTHGWKVYYLDGSEVIHLGGGSAKRTSARQLVRLYDSKLHFFRKNYGFWQASLLKAGLILVNLLGLFRRVPVGLIRYFKGKAIDDRIISQWLLLRWLCMGILPGDIAGRRASGKST